MEAQVRYGQRPPEQFLSAHVSAHVSAHASQMIAHSQSGSGPCHTFSYIDVPRCSGLTHSHVGLYMQKCQPRFLAHAQRCFQ